MRCVYPLSQFDFVNFFFPFAGVVLAPLIFHSGKKEEAHVARVEHMIPFCVSKNAGACRNQRAST